MLRKFSYLFFIVLLVSFTISGCSTKSGKSNRTPIGTLELGEPTQVAAASIGQNGGTITIDKSESVLNGLELTVPEGSYTETRQFKISSATVVSQTFGPNFNPVSPLISIDNGAGYSEEIMTLEIPVEIPEGNFAMAFYYDDKLGTLEGIPVLAQSNNSITITTRHFSDIVVSSIPESELSGDAEVDTGFLPGIDDWQFTNLGSYIAPGGHCAGQSITALWYYSQMKSAGETSLYGRYNEGTRDLWQDDARAYRFASTIQEDVDWNAWEVRYNKLKPKAQHDNSMVWKQFVYSMKVTGEPQFIYIQNTAAGGAHAMIAYGVSGGALQIADPNYPGKLDREIWYDRGEFEAYNSGANAQEILNGKGKAYDLMLYFGTSSLIDFSSIESRWGEFEEGTIGNDRFPAYVLKTYNEENDVIELQDGFKTKNKTINIFGTSDAATIAFYVLRDDVRIMPTQEGGSEFALQPGNNLLGLYIVGDKGGWEYVDFKYINVKCEQPTTSKAVASKDKPVITEFSGPDKFEFDSSNSVVGLYKFSVSVEGGTAPYYYSWMGNRAPQLLKEGTDCAAITISPQYMRQPGAIKDGFFIWVTVKDAKGNYATFKRPDGTSSNEYMYALKFTGKFEIIDGVTRLVDNTWEKMTEP
jgi:hypothetical protein